MTNVIPADVRREIIDICRQSDFVSGALKYGLSDKKRRKILLKHITDYALISDWMQTRMKDILLAADAIEREKYYAIPKSELVDMENELCSVVSLSIGDPHNKRFQSAVTVVLALIESKKSKSENPEESEK